MDFQRMYYLDEMKLGIRRICMKSIEYAQTTSLANLFALLFDGLFPIT